jgi:hypothetical protein
MRQRLGVSETGDMGRLLLFRELEMCRLIPIVIHLHPPFEHPYTAAQAATRDQ